MKSLIKLFTILSILIFCSCKDKINNPADNPENLFKVEGHITHDGLPVRFAQITLDTLICKSDSTGYFLFDSLKSGASRITIVHPQFVTVDSVININRDLTFLFDLQFQLYKVEGNIKHNGLPLPSIQITLDNLLCTSDSTGYFLFDNLKSGQSEIKIVHPQFTTLDTLINIDRDLTFSFDMQYKSDSFLPLKIGNKWYYNQKPDNSGYEFIIEVVGTEEIEGLSYYNLKLTHYYNNIPPESTYWGMRISNDSLYRYSCDEVELLVPFNIEEGKHFNIHSCSIDYSGNLTEKINDELNFNYIAGLVTDTDFSFRFQKGIGITIYTIDGWDYFVLDHYEINR